MILKPQPIDLRIISHFLGKIILGFAMMMAFPVATALLFKEVSAVVDFSVGLLAALCVGFILIDAANLPRNSDMSWMHGMVVVSLGWLMCMCLGAIPLFLSGHWKAYIDACFESMSALATTGLTLAQDLDHLSHAANLWRHLMMFLGGQGIIIIALSFLVKGGPGAFRLYVGEARDEKILPNVVETSKFIWFVSFVYLILGTFFLAVCGRFLCGMPLSEAIFHGLCNFMAAFDTGGFMPQSQNVIYYQSSIYEAITIIIMIWGSINFNLHYAVWNGRKKEFFKDIEIRVFFATLTVTTVLTLIGLAKWDVYLGPINLFRRGFFQVVSAHSGTGFQSIYPQQFVTEWGSLAMMGVIIAMGLGVSACSTTGGIKMLRIGVIAKAFREDIKKFLSSESAVVSTKLRHLKDLFLEDRMVRSAALITLAYIICYLVGAIIGSFFGYPFLLSLFESTSAAGNVGLSCGITQASMPVLLKIVYIIEMWAGRLEFISVLVFVGFFVSFLKGR